TSERRTTSGLPRTATEMASSIFPKWGRWSLPAGTGDAKAAGRVDINSKNTTMRDKSFSKVKVGADSDSGRHPRAPDRSAQDAAFEIAKIANPPKRRQQ